MNSNTQSSTVSLVQFGRTRLTELVKRSERLSSEARHVAACKHTHREHQINWRGLDPARQFHSGSGQLPKTVWLGAVGGFLLDAIEVNINLNQDVHALCKEIALLESELFLAKHLLSGDEESRATMDNIEQSIAASARLLVDQDIAELRDEALRMLTSLLQDKAGEVVDEQKELRNALLGLINRHIEIAITEAGYHTVPKGRQLCPSMLVSKAVELVQEAQETIPAAGSGRGLREGEHATISVNLDRAVGCCLLAFSGIAEQHALLSPDSTIGGRMAILQSCVGALKPLEPAEAHEVADYRRKHDHQRAGQQVSTRLQQFTRDWQRSSQDLQQCVELIAKAQTLKSELSQVRTF